MGCLGWETGIEPPTFGATVRTSKSATCVMKWIGFCCVGEIRVVGLSWREFVQRKVQHISSIVLSVGLNIGHCLNLVQRPWRFFGREHLSWTRRELRLPANS